MPTGCGQDPGRWPDDQSSHMLLQHPRQTES